MALTSPTSIRNIAIIAHVDHGKTTLVDAMLKQSGAFRANQNITERAMDSNDLERERGITILAKCTSITWNDVRINIVDTPGHADFGGEVERILSMVDGVILLVDATEGPMSQTKFVLGKALKLNLLPIVVINKIDRSDARQEEVLDEILELFMALEANDDQLDFPIIYASGKSGWAVSDLKDERVDVTPLFDLILKHVPTPKTDNTAPFSMIVTTLEYDTYLGKILTGRIENGIAKVNMPIKVMNRYGGLVETGRISKLSTFQGLERIPVNSASAGNIITLAGLEKVTVSDTIATPEVIEPLPTKPIDLPTITITFSINDSPLAGREGTKLTSHVLHTRFIQEAERNIAIHIKKIEGKDVFEVAGRGELQFGVLIETMRREGFELSISRPKVLYKNDPETGACLEPYEEVQIDVDDEFSGTVIQSMGKRKGEIIDMRPSGGGKTRIVFICPSRGLISYYGPFLNETRGTGIMNRIFHSYAPYRGVIEGRKNGVLISNSDGEATSYALWNLEERGKMFINPGEKVYEGMIIGEHNRDNDLNVNPVKGKQLSNVRDSGKDAAIRLTPPLIMTLEQAISYIKGDEQVEVTPKSIRIRKALLNSNDRKRINKTTY